MARKRIGFWAVVNWASNVYFVVTVGAVFFIGLAGGLITTIRRFPLGWRIPTVVGGLGLALAIVAWLVQSVRLFLARRAAPPESGGAIRQTMVEVGAGGAVGTLGMQGNVMTIATGGGSIFGGLAPLPLEDEDLKAKLRDFSRAVGAFLRDREASSPVHEMHPPISRVARDLSKTEAELTNDDLTEWYGRVGRLWSIQNQNEYAVASQRHSAETIKLYRERFDPRAIALYQELRRRGRAVDLEGRINASMNTLLLEDIVRWFGVLGEDLNASPDRM